MRMRQPRGRPKTTCSKCGKPLDETRKGKQRYCKACHAQHMRLNRKKHGELTSEQRKKANARSYANVLERRGKIVLAPCSICGAEEAEKHHADYDEPGKVTWLCRTCHLKMHNGQR